MVLYQDIPFFNIFLSNFFHFDGRCHCWGVLFFLFEEKWDNSVAICLIVTCGIATHMSLVCSGNVHVTRQMMTFLYVLFVFNLFKCQPTLLVETTINLRQVYKFVEFFLSSGQLFLVCNVMIMHKKCYLEGTNFRAVAL